MLCYIQERVYARHDSNHRTVLYLTDDGLHQRHILDVPVVDRVVITFLALSPLFSFVLAEFLRVLLQHRRDKMRRTTPSKQTRR